MVHALETKHSEKSEAEIERQKQVRTDPGTTWALFAVYRGLFSPVLYRDYFISYYEPTMECHWWVSLLTWIGNQMDGQLPSQTENVVSKDFGVEISSFGFSVVTGFGVFRDVWPYQYVLNLKWPESTY